MPSSIRFIRLRDLLGGNPSEWTESHLEGLVKSAVREDEDLDFKRELYGNSDSAKRDLAGDLASFANHRGGVIVIGIEDEGDVAARLNPVELSDGEEARIRQIAAGNIFPHLPIELYDVPSENKPGFGYYVLAVSTSPLRPHAIRKGRDLRYPRRDGTTTRWLAESEVADLYRDRFRSNDVQLARVNPLLDEGLGGMNLREGWAQLAVRLVSTTSGSMELSFERIREIEGWATEGNPVYWRGFFRDRPRGRSGNRRVKLGSLSEDRLPVSGYAELHTNGDGFCCTDVGRIHPQWSGEGLGPRDIPGLTLIWSVARELRLLGRHATENAGAWGDALVETRLVGNQLNLTRPAHGGHFQDDWNERPLEGPLLSQHTVPLSSLVQSDQELLGAARLVVTDHFNEFGCPEVREIDPYGRIRIGYVVEKGRVREMAERSGVEVTEDPV